MTSNAGLTPNLEGRTGEGELRAPSGELNLRFVRNVVLKGLLLFVIVNLAFAWIGPLPALGRVSAYNSLFPGRVRLPYGDIPERAYNLSLYNLEAMFASHEISRRPKPGDEFRVILIGDSATWGFLLPPADTLSANINALQAKAPDGRSIRAFNLGYPVMSLTKDLLILDESLRYQPDLIVWLVTLESFPYDKQLFPPLLQNNPQRLRRLIETFGLSLDPQDPQLLLPGFWDRTLIGSRRALADLLRLQFYGPLWAATGIDQDLPSEYSPPQEDFSTDLSFHNLSPPTIQREDLALDVLQAGLQAAGAVPVLIGNEPMFISQGTNSDLRYNFYYPRWAYDGYRALLAEESKTKGWLYRDYWDLVDPQEFTNSAVHLSPAGSRQFAQRLLHDVLQLSTGQ